MKTTEKKIKLIAFRTTKKMHDLIEANTENKSNLINYALFRLFYCKPGFTIQEIVEGEKYDYYSYEDYLENNLGGNIDLEECINSLGMWSEWSGEKQVLNSHFKHA